MSLLQIISRIISICVFPFLLVGIFFALNANSPIYNYLIWLLLVGVIINWIGWGIWGSIVTVTLIVLITVYTGMVTGNIIYIIEILPAIILVSILYYHEERIKRSVTTKKLGLDDKERTYNLLLQEYKKHEALRSAYYKKTKRFSRLSQIAKELGFILTPDEINRAIISNLIKTIENGDIYILCGISADLENLKLQILESPAGALPLETSYSDDFNTWVMRHRQPLIVSDIAKDYRFNTKDILAKTRIRSLIISPIITGDRLLGIIRIDSYKPETFTVDDLRLLAIISNIGALTIYNAQLYKQTEYLAIRDALTGLYVKGYFQENLEKLIIESRIGGKPFSLLLLDLDNFKELNDQFGHSVGDKVLQKVAELMQKGSPAQALTARYGGEEFAIILRDDTKAEAKDTAERIKSLIEEHAFLIRREGAHITVSIGVVEFPLEGNTSEELIDTADKRLYEAKRNGRNRVVG